MVWWFGGLVVFGFYLAAVIDVIRIEISLLMLNFVESFRAILIISESDSSGS